jgi:hypothetical protein
LSKKDSFIKKKKEKKHFISLNFDQNIFIIIQKKKNHILFKFHYIIQHS